MLREDLWSPCFGVLLRPAGGRPGHCRAGIDDARPDSRLRCLARQRFRHPRKKGCLSATLSHQRDAGMLNPAESLKARFARADSTSLNGASSALFGCGTPPARYLRLAIPSVPGGTKRTRAMADVAAVRRRRPFPGDGPCQVQAIWERSRWFASRMDRTDPLVRAPSCHGPWYALVAPRRSPTACHGPRESGEVPGGAAGRGSSSR